MSRKVLKEIRIDEISGVDSPAQEKATVAIIKRKDVKKYNDRYDLLTSIDSGHQHGARFRVYDHDPTIDLSYATGDGLEDHTHPVVIQDGNAVIGTVHGHSHTLDLSELITAIKDRVFGKGKTNVANEETKSDETSANVTELEKKLSRANAIVALNAECRKYYNSLDDSEQDEYLELNPSEQMEQVKKELKKQAEADPVVYTTSDGVELRKSAGEAAIALAKRVDAITKENAELRKNREDSRFERIAKDELSKLPGELNTHISIVRALETIENEDTRKAAFDVIKAHNEAFTQAQKTIGKTSSNDEVASDDEKLVQKAKKMAKDDDIPFAEAYASILDTAEGRSYYEKQLN